MPGLHGDLRQHAGRRVQPVPRPHRPSRRPAGAEAGQRDPAEGPDRQARRHPLLPGGRRSPPRRQVRQGRAGHAELPGRQLGRHHVDRSRAPARDPVQLPGKVYLAGPYKGAPLSLVAITPAVQGPFDLGTVVVRIALDVDPMTAQINAVSDIIPDVFGGVKLDIRAIDFNMDRSSSCSTRPIAMPGATSRRPSTAAAPDPANPAAFSSYAFNVAVPGDRLRQARLQAEAEGAAVRADRRGLSSRASGDPGSPHGRRQHQPHRADPAARAVPRTEPHRDRLHEPETGLAHVPGRLGLRTGGSGLAAARRKAVGPGLPGALGQRAAGPGRRPAGPGRDPAARRDQLQARRSADGVQRGPGRPGDEVRPQHAGRQEEPPGELDEHLQRQAAGRAQHHGPEREDASKNNKFPLDIASCAKKKKHSKKHHKQRRRAQAGSDVFAPARKAE